MILGGVFTRRHYKPKNAKINSDVTITLILKGGLRIYNTMTMSKSYHLKIFLSEIKLTNNKDLNIN